MKIVSSKKTKIFVIGIVAAICLAGYVAYSQYYHEVGFPLDDAWIHQTYARNLVEFGEWSFIPGKLSAGSTSPLWTVLLTPAYIFKISPIVWTNLLGWLLLWGVGIASMYLFEQINPEHERCSFWVGVCMVSEWHMVWAAGSGMETLLFALMLLIPFLDFGLRRYVWIFRGLLIGASIWVRPDGIILLLPIFMIIWIKEPTLKSKILASISCLMGVFILFIPYLGFNKHLSGDWWPNTFYAKQMEYAIMRQTPFVSRYLREFLLPLIGIGALLLFGYILFLFKSIIHKHWENLASVVIFLSYLGVYAWRLPVTYQHGRYIIPVMPLFFIIGLSGMADQYKNSLERLFTRVLYKAWILSSGIVAVSFLILGAQAYGRDVGFIQSEMVAIAKWITNNTEPDALVAAHDIGALGYWGNRNILDLAGLISPEVIPFIRDEYKIQQYLNGHQIDYLVTFPNWYPYLSSLGEKIYQTHGKISILLGGENMVIYRWNTRP